jgi:type III pantothenate kinase
MQQLCLMIGNSRLHWGWFQDEKLIKVEHTPHFQRPNWPELPLYIASVVPSQTDFWRKQATRLITLTDIPLTGIYPTIGIDRVLSVYGAGIQYGFPCLVIDCGTALTFTAVSGDRHLAGGAILPGLGLQLRSLSTKTAALPSVTLPEKLPELYAKNTEEAIISGVVYNLLAGIELFINNWLAEFPDSNICITGGDSDKLLSYFSVYNYQLSQRIIQDENLIFWGIKKVIS